MRSHARIRVERTERVWQRDVCEGAQRRLLGALAACEALARIAGAKVRVQGAAAEIVEKPVEIVRDRVLRVAARKQLPCHNGWMPRGGGSCA